MRIASSFKTYQITHLNIQAIGVRMSLNYRQASNHPSAHLSPTTCTSSASRHTFNDLPDPQIDHRRRRLARISSSRCRNTALRLLRCRLTARTPRSGSSSLLTLCFRLPLLAFKPRLLLLRNPLLALRLSLLPRSRGPLLPFSSPSPYSLSSPSLFSLPLFEYLKFTHTCKFPLHVFLVFHDTCT